MAGTLLVVATASFLTQGRLVNYTEYKARHSSQWQDRGKLPGDFFVEEGTCQAPRCKVIRVSEKVTF